MRIKSLQLKNFKRFTDLTLQDIPESAKLVLLVGSNGSGKSSVFDAFEILANRPGKEMAFHDNESYYSKNDSKNTSINARVFHKQSGTGKITELEWEWRDNEYKTSENYSKSFYGRTAFRYLPALTKRTYDTGFKINEDPDSPSYYNEFDKRFENDIDIIMESIMKIVFGEFSNGKHQRNEVGKFVNKINSSFVKIFGEKENTTLNLSSILPPADGNPIRLLFTKGESVVHYNLLSAGEKEVVNLIFNLYTRTPYFDDTIYFIDEMDSHLNTSLQYNLLKEITENWIPENCQLWTASHSLGFIDYANDSRDAAIIDFDDLDFDLPQELRPTPKNNAEVFELAVSKEFIDKLLKDRKIYFAEGTDTALYNNLALKDTFFFKADGGKADVFHKAINFNQRGVVDRDYLSDEEVIALRTVYPMLCILPYYSIENLIYHPYNLEEYFKNQGKPFDKNKYIQNIIAAKNEGKDSLLLGIIQARSGYPFYKENENAKKLKAFKDSESAKEIAELLKSDDLETFYKVFPAKDLGKRIGERQNINRTELAKTNWFKTQIEKILNEPN